MSAYLEPLEDGPRCKKWKLVVSVGSGKGRRRKSRKFEGGKREAQDALREFEQSVFIPASDAGFEEFATRWNDARFASGAISQQTHDKYKWHVAAFKPYFDKNLDEITPCDVTAAYAALRGSRGWSGTTLASAHQSLVRIFRAARDEGYIGESPMGAVDSPRTVTKEKKALTPEQSRELLDKLNVLEPQPFAVSLMLRCGLRRGEAVGLEWRDYDGKRLHVRREVTKSGAGVRDIPLDDETVDVLEKRRKAVSACLEAVGDALRPEDGLCCGLDGRPLTKDALRVWWDRHKKEYGMDGWTLHELRHTFLTNLAQAGAHPSVMQRLAGHASMNTTLRIYTHVHDKDMAEAVANMAELRKSAPQSAPRGIGKKNR